MTLTRLLSASLVVCSALAFAQTKTDSPASSAQAAATNKLATVASSEPWKIIPSQPMHATSGSNGLDRLQIDKYKMSRSKTDTRTLLLGPEADAGMILSGLDGQLDADIDCLKIRSYVVARDSKDSDSTHLVRYSTCQPASRYRLKTTDLRSGSEKP
ncbi:MAG: hypothetical protein ACXVZV_13065 [Terriglobales bacterium]